MNNECAQLSTRCERTLQSRQSNYLEGEPLAELSDSPRTTKTLRVRHDVERVVPVVVPKGRAFQGEVEASTFEFQRDSDPGLRRNG